MSNGANINDGFTNDELLNIGTRKTKLDLNISATDINRSIPYDISKLAISQMPGFSDHELQDIGERRMAGIPLPTSDTIHGRLDAKNMGAVESTLEKLQSFLGIRTR